MARKSPIEPCDPH